MPFGKIKGIPAMQIFLLAVSIVFQHKSLYMQMNLYPDTLHSARIRSTVS